jgi:hypothetical protein
MLTHKNCNFIFIRSWAKVISDCCLQVEMICERMLREREAELREEYERILHMKLADQYEQFVKFTYDQLHRGFSNTEPPSCKFYCYSVLNALLLNNKD